MSLVSLMNRSSQTRWPQGGCELRVRDTSGACPSAILPNRPLPANHASPRASSMLRRNSARPALGHWRNNGGSTRHKKGPVACPGLSIHLCGLSSELAPVLHRLLDRTVGVLGEACVHGAELGHLVHVLIIGALGVGRLNLERLLERLGAQELLEGGRSVLEGTLRVVAHLGGDGLPALVPIAEHLHGVIHIGLAELLKVLEIVDHGGACIVVVRGGVEDRSGGIAISQKTMIVALQ